MESDKSFGDNDFEEPPPPKYTRKNYDLSKKFQMEWYAKCLWAEMVLAEDGILHMVRCRVCIEMGKKTIVMDSKLHTLKENEKKCSTRKL